jgi:hypothetical protein
MTRQRILAEIRNEVDTFGLIEDGQPMNTEENPETTDSDWNY